MQATPIEEGIKFYLLKNLKLVVKNFKEKEKLCMLMFDEISISPHIEYNKVSDVIVGLDDNGQICDHVLVFMVREVTRKWKQPMSFNFCRGAIDPNKNAD